MWPDDSLIVEADKLSEMSDEDFALFAKIYEARVARRSAGP